MKCPHLPWEAQILDKKECYTTCKLLQWKMPWGRSTRIRYRHLLPTMALNVAATMTMLTSWAQKRLLASLQANQLLLDKPPSAQLSSANSTRSMRLKLPRLIWKIKQKLGLTCTKYSATTSWKHRWALDQLVILCRNNSLTCSLFLHHLKGYVRPRAAKPPDSSSTFRLTVCLLERTVESQTQSVRQACLDSTTRIALKLLSKVLTRPNRQLRTRPSPAITKKRVKQTRMKKHVKNKHHQNLLRFNQLLPWQLTMIFSFKRVRASLAQSW